MPATLRFSETNGATPTQVSTPITSAAYGNVDLVNLVAADHPVTVPNTGGPNYSYEKWWRVQVASMGGSAKVDNLRFWKNAGNYVAGETMAWSLASSRQNDPYTTPINTLGVADTPVLTGEPAQNVFTAFGASNDELNADLQFSDYIVVQAAIAVGAPLGAVNPKTFRLHYDEL